MTVKEFSKKYQISQQAVYAKIKRKSAQLDGHVTKSGGQLVIDKYAKECLKPNVQISHLLEKFKIYKISLMKKFRNVKN